MTAWPTATSGRWAAPRCGGSDSGFNLLLLPNSTQQCNLLGTTVTDIAPRNKNIINTWAGLDYGVSAAGYNTNNMAIGRLILDALGLRSIYDVELQGRGRQGRQQCDVCG